MGRGGTTQEEARQVIREIASFPNLVIEGIFTHFSESEILSYYNDLQWRAFGELLEKLETDGLRIPIRHISNSGAILNYPQFHLDMVRPGIMSYGIYPSPETRDKAALAPVMSFKTRVVLVKEFPEGYSIGYGRTFITRRPTRIATIPVGYGDGFGWLLSNQGEALIRGKRAPIAGRISMDMCTLDVSHIPECLVGDEVVLMGEQGGERITADEIAAKTPFDQLRDPLRPRESGRRGSSSTRGGPTGWNRASGGSSSPTKKNRSPGSTTSSATASRRGRATRNSAMRSTTRCSKPSSERRTASSNCGTISATASG